MFLARGGETENTRAVATTNMEGSALEEDRS